MTAVIVRHKDVGRLGKELLKEVYSFLHDEYILTNFEEMKVEQEKLLHSLVHIEFRKFHSTEKQSGNTWKFEYETYDESKFDEDVEKLKSRVENGSIDTDIIFKSLINLRLDMEIDEDLYFKRLAFLDLFRVIDTHYIYLQD